MPVEDHPVHEKTKSTTTTPYGCHNHSPREEGYYKAIHSLHHGEFKLETVWIPYVMSTDCRYDMAGSDGRCGGCRHKGVQ